MPDILNQTVALADCRDNPRNYNQHSPEQIANLAASLRQFGQVRSVVVQDDPAGGYVIVAGHGVITAARRLGWPSLRADVIPADWPPDRVLAYLAADNELARASSPDDAQLAALVAELAEQGDAELARLAAGSAARLEELLASLTGDEPGDETTDAGDQTAKADAAQAKWAVQPGELFTLGAHKLLCGDSTDPAQVARLMGDDRARLAFTDPPYGVSYSGKGASTTGGIAGDDLRRDGLIALLQPALRNLVDFSLGEAAFYIWHASDTRREFEWVLDAVGLQERQYITWVKDGFSLGHADYHWACEYVFYATRAGHSCPFYGGRDQTTIWRLGATTEQAVFVIGDGLLISDGRASTLFIKTSAPRGKKWRTLRLTPGQAARLRAEYPTGTDAWHVTRDPVADYWHPTQKPAALARRAIQNHTEAGEIVLDLFGGSGSTLLAAQAEGRAARLCELEPKFCSAVLERWVLSGGTEPTRAAAPSP